MGALLGGEFQHGAVVDGRQLALDALVALGLQLGLALEAGIQPAGHFQALGGGGVAVEAAGLRVALVPGDAEPGQVLLDRGHELGLVAGDVGVVEAQQELAAMPPCQQVVGERHAGVADMQQPGGGGGEAELHGLDPSEASSPFV